MEATRMRRWQVFGVVGAGSAVAYLFAADSAGLRLVLFDGLSAAAVVALVAGARSSPPSRRLPWHLLAAGLSLILLGDVIYFVRALVDPGDASFPSIGDVAYLVSYPLSIAGTVLLIRARSPGRDVAALIDATIIAVGVGVLAWQFLLEPYVTDPGLAPLAKVVVSAYPVMDLVMLAVVVRLAVGSGARPPSFYLLTGALVAHVAVDAVYALRVLAESYQLGEPLDLGWLAFYTLLGAAALHPSAVRLTERGQATEQRLTPRRLALLAAASLLAPLVDVAINPEVAHLALALPTIFLFGLVIARMAGLVRALEASLAQVAELQRRRGERRFASLVRSSADVVLVLDASGVVSYASPSARAMLGEDPTGWTGDRVLAPLHPDDLGRFAAQLPSVRAGPAGVSGTSVQVRSHHPDGSWRHLEVITTNLLDDPDVAGVVLNSRDVTERAALEEQLRHLAFHDPLTGLPNRSLFADRVQHALDRASRTGAQTAVLFCDLDDFKTVNDSLGHEAGDQLLIGVAERLRAVLRTGDTAARLGGDEFGVLLEDLRGERDAEEAAERLLAALRAPWSVADTDIAGSASVGLAYGDEAEQATDLLRHADAAMYEAKTAGKGTWARYHPSMQAGALRRLQLTAELDRALERDEFFLVYQPIVDLALGTTVGVEALVRWQHPEHGVVSPVEFIGVAEATGHIVALGRWVLEQACQQARAWLDELGPDARFSVSVNVSARQLADPQLVQTVVAALEQARLDPARLVIELTESVLVRDADHALKAFTELRRLGVRLAIDDLGTGYSSLSYLRRLPVDIIKVDKAFVDDLGNGAVEATLARGIVELTRTLGVTALAEGVEREAQLHDLQALGCQLGQGYHFARPLPAADVLPLLSTRPARLMQRAL